MDGFFLAEGQGFEPWIPFGGTRAFQTRLFSHSSILPFGTANIQIFLKSLRLLTKSTWRDPKPGKV